MGITATIYPVAADELESVAGDDIYDVLEDGPEPVDLDKAWHVLHYLLTGTAEATDNPLGVLLEAGQKLEASEDVHFLSADHMRAFRDALSAVGDEEFRLRYDPAAMERQRVYLADALAQGPPDETWDDMAEAIGDLRVLADTCVERGLGAVVVLS